MSGHFHELLEEGSFKEFTRGAQLHVVLFVVDVHEDHVELGCRAHLVVNDVFVSIGNY